MIKQQEAPRLDLLASLKLPLKLAIGAGGLTAAVTLFLPNYYRSEARLLPVETKAIGGNLGGLASAAAAFGVNIPMGDGNDANFVDVLQSRWLREQLLKTEFEYHTRFWRFGADRPQRGTLFDYMEERNMDRAVSALGLVVGASRDLKSKVITLTAETRSPELSQLIVRRATKLLEEFLQQKGRTRGGAKAAFAEARLADARREMEQAEESCRRFLEVNRGYATSTDPAVRLKGNRLDAELRLRQQLVTTLAMNREQALLEEKNDIPILNVLDSGNLPVEKSRPSRSLIILALTALAGVGSWSWQNREWLRAQLAAGEDAATEAPTEEA